MIFDVDLIAIKIQRELMIELKETWRKETIMIA